jgi:coenzyme F420 biosynthesis associated uncharacterized protein
MAQQISWATASGVAKFVGDRSPNASAAELAELRVDLDEIVPEAIAEVAEFTGIDVDESPPRIEVVDRSDWVDANLESYRFLVDRVSRSLGGRAGSFGVDHLTGASVGAMIGWMSTRVLGQYDLLLQQGAAPTPGIVYFVGPNIIHIERIMGFQRQQFRHWVALHELTHRTQFEGIPWFRGYFSGLVDELIAFTSPSVSQIVDQARKMIIDRDIVRSSIAEFGLAGIFASEAQIDALRRVSVLMSLAEGHGDWVMDRAAGRSIPEAWRFSSTLSERRSSASGASKFMQTILGMEAKLGQYAKGEAFIQEVEDRSPGSSRMIWESVSSLPTFEEFSSPARWLERCAPR